MKIVCLSSSYRSGYCADFLLGPHNYKIDSPTLKNYSKYPHTRRKIIQTTPTQRTCDDGHIPEGVLAGDGSIRMSAGGVSGVDRRGGISLRSVPHGRKDIRKEVKDVSGKSTDHMPGRGKAIR